MVPEELGRWLLAIARHLKVYTCDPRITALYATQNSARHGDLLLRIRGLTTVNKRKLDALALDAGIAHQEMDHVLPRLEKTGLITIHRIRGHQGIERITESILTESEVYRATAEIFEALNPMPSERAMAPLLAFTSQLPANKEEVFNYLCQQGFHEQDVSQALELQEAFGLVRQQYVPDLRVDLFYNEYLWQHKIGQIAPILAKLDYRQTEGIRAVIEEVRAFQGRSLDRLSSAPPRTIALAAKTGILDTTTIVTASQDSKTFAFSPHFYGYRAGTQPTLIDDYSSQVKLLVASIAYGANHSKNFRLHSPEAFLRRLLRDGEAGNATPILSDYVLLEKQGIVKVEERACGRGTFVLQKRDVVEHALDVMTSGSLLVDDGESDDVRALSTQQAFRTPEEDRLLAGFGQTAGCTEQFDRDYLAAIREAALGGAL